MKKAEEYLDEQFPNGFESWYETFYEVVDKIQFNLLHQCQSRNEVDSYIGNVIINIDQTEGRGGLYLLAKRLTDKFELQYKNKEWDGDFVDTIDEFLKEELYEKQGSV